MDKNEFEGKWKQIRSQSKVWWSRINDSDLNKVDKAEIKFFEYVTILQLKYRLDRPIAKDEVGRRVAERDASMERKTDLSPLHNRGGATTPFPLRMNMDQQKTHGIPCRSNIHIGDKNEPSHIPYRRSSNRLGGN